MGGRAGAGAGERGGASGAAEVGLRGAGVLRRLAGRLVSPIARSARRWRRNLFGGVSLTRAILTPEEKKRLTESGAPQ
jgi:hypothetical protein